MLVVSLWTSLLGLAEPFFVPEYWSPPSLFDLAARTGFDIESIFFSFGVGGIAAVLYESVFRVRHQKLSQAHGHRSHLWALLSAPVFFFALMFFTEWNPIYPAVLALAVAGLLTLYCRSDLKKKMFASGALFTILYFVYFLTLELIFPGYVEEVWNLAALSGIFVWSVPLEELLFAFAFGFVWSSVYEYLTGYLVATRK